MPVDIDTLVLLVGAQPLPNYLAMPHWRLDGCASSTLNKPRMSLRYSRRSPERLGIADGSLIALSSATDAASIARAIQFAPGTVHLNYTGGTKVMALHARLAHFSNASTTLVEFLRSKIGGSLFSAARDLQARSNFAVSSVQRSLVVGGGQSSQTLA
jgi:hypothetical protein